MRLQVRYIGHIQLAIRQSTWVAQTISAVTIMVPLTGTFEAIPIDSVGDHEAVSYAWTDLGLSNSANDI